MPSSPKVNLARLERILNAWETIAPTKSFGGMTLDEFRPFVVRCRTTRATLLDLADKTTVGITDREDADTDGLARALLMVNGVRADPTEGENSALYEAIGYTLKRERKSGLTRKKKDSGTPKT